MQPTRSRPLPQGFGDLVPYPSTVDHKRGPQDNRPIRRGRRSCIARSRRSETVRVHGTQRDPRAKRGAFGTGTSMTVYAPPIACNAATLPIQRGPTVIVPGSLVMKRDQRSLPFRAQVTAASNRRSFLRRPVSLPLRRVAAGRKPACAGFSTPFRPCGCAGRLRGDRCGADTASIGGAVLQGDRHDP